MNIPKLIPLIGAAVLVASPAIANPIIIQSDPYSYRSQPMQGNFIYGSPIPTPMPVNPMTGLSPDINYYPYQAPIRGRIEDTTLINPRIINSTIRDSVLINPVIINRQPRRSPSQAFPFIPRIIYRYP